MSGAKAWRPLPLANSSNIPALLTSFELGISNYSLQLTDMANVWEEALDRKAICIRAWGENTSIDPSDTQENMTKFLSSLASALDATRPGHDVTSLRLSPGSTDKTGHDGITIQVTCRLPGFPDLKWPFHLKKSPISSIATNLVLPLTEALYTRKMEVESLIQLLKQKDSVISKLSDKLEATGTGLDSIFTVLAGRKNVTRSVAEDKIKGLGAFDERTWTAKLKNEDDEPSNLNGLAQAVYGGTGLQYQATMQIDSSLGLDQWWHDFQPASRLVIRGQGPEGQRPRSPSLAAEANAADDDDDEFQIQSTPPHLKSLAKNASPVPLKRESPESGTQPSIATQPAKKIGGKLGTIGGKKPSPPPRPPTPQESSPPPAPPPAADDDETASETGSDADETDSLPDEIPSTPPAPSPKKRGLGRIGGGPSVAKGKSADGQQDAKPPAPRKLGVIGNTPKPAGCTTSAAVNSEASRGRPATRKQEEEVAQARETSQERADKKREELKRELEKKAAAGPAKKKRKF